LAATIAIVEAAPKINSNATECAGPIVSETINARRAGEFDWMSSPLG
jgi:hypothetical protein